METVQKDQTAKVQTRTIATQTYLNMNSSHFEKNVSSIIKYDKKMQTNLEHKIAMQTEVSTMDDTLDQSHVKLMNDCTSNIEIESEKYKTLDECDQNISGEDFESPAESSTYSETEPDSDAEDNLTEQNNKSYILSNEKPASEQIKIVVFEAAIVNAFIQRYQPYAYFPRAVRCRYPEYWFGVK